MLLAILYRRPVLATDASSHVRYARSSSSTVPIQGPAAVAKSLPLAGPNFGREPYHEAQLQVIVDCHPCVRPAIPNDHGRAGLHTVTRVLWATAPAVGPAACAPACGCVGDGRGGPGASDPAADRRCRHAQPGHHRP